MSSSHKKTSNAALTLGAIGVVYGDIGTSVLYSIKEVFASGHVNFTPDNVYGILSLFVWTITLIVSLKYITLVLKADNHGEGGLVAMLALASQAIKDRPKLHPIIMLIGIFGTCLFYGEGVITPAISVLSAVEGVTVISPSLHSVVIPATIAILFLLFFIQKFGTKGIGKFFGPLMVVWFLLIGGLGLYHIQSNIGILAAINPLYAISFIAHNPLVAFILLGAVVLCVTGAEALYADMGHFGKRPIRLAWFLIVMPALILNYFGQGAFLLAHPEAKDNPFFLMIPDMLRIPMVVMATLATVIASQALISGAFSITKQVIQLGYLPRMRVVYTNVREAGQIYIPLVNWGLFVAIAFAVVMFKSSGALAAAYGIAVCTDMLITTILTYFVVRYAWKYSAPVYIGATAFFFCIDFMFWSSNMLKLFKGGWFPLMLGGIMFTIMTTWREGRRLVSLAHQSAQGNLQEFLDEIFESFHPTNKADGSAPLSQFPQSGNVDLVKNATTQTVEDVALVERPLVGLCKADRLKLLSKIKKVKGIAVFMTAEEDIIPTALKQNLKHNKVLHEYNIFVTVKTHETPWIGLNKRTEVTNLGHNCWKVIVNFGFKNDPDVPDALEHISQFNFDFVTNKASYFLSHEAVVPTIKEGMALWREKLFAHMHHNAGTAAEFLHLPSNNVVEMGAKVEI